MSARMILHIVVTVVLLAIGWYLYADLTSGTGYDSVTVATYWFAVLVFIFFSWLFYWFVHKLKLKAWLISLILAVLIAAIGSYTLRYIAEDHQQKLEEEVIQKEQEQAQDEEQIQESTSPSNEIETLNLGEELLEEE